MKDKLKALGWAYGLAWKVNKWVLLSWCLLVSLISILPAIGLIYNRAIIDALDGFINTGSGTFDELLPTIIVFGLITVIIGLSNRFSTDFLYSVMYNTYYFGLAEYLMDSIDSFSMEEMMDKALNDEYRQVLYRCGALTDIVSNTCAILGKIFGLGSLLIVAISLSLPIFAISLIYIIFIIWLHIIYLDKLKDNFKKIREEERLSAHYEHMPTATDFAKEIRIFNTKDKLIDSWKQSYKPIYKYYVKNAFDIESRAFISNICFYLFLSGMTVYSVFAVAGGRMTAAVLLVIFTMCMSIYTSLSGITRTIQRFDFGLFAIERQYRMLAIKGDKVGGLSTPATGESCNFPPDSSVVFEAKNLSFSYPGREELALDNISISIKKGESIALVGANGSGKSTLVKLLLQIYSPRDGKLLFYGQDYSNLENGFLRNKVGVFFQDYCMFHAPIWENIGFGDIDNVNDREKIMAALIKGGAKNIIDRLPNGIDTYLYRNVEKDGADFSGGENQKLAISRAHMSNKDILIFDEPASMLDPIAELEQFMNIKEKSLGCTSILISHRVGFARLADKIILLDKGKVAEVGTHEELMRQKGLYANFFEEQARWYKGNEAE